MPKIKKIKEIKSKVRIIKELPKEESDLIEDIKKAEKDGRKSALAAAADTEFKAPSMVLESNIPAQTEQASEIQEDTRARREIEQRNTEIRGAVGDTTAYASRRERREYLPYSSTAQPVAQGATTGDIQQMNAVQQRASPFEKKSIQPEAVQREQERDEQYQAQKQKRRYPWER